MHAAPVPYRAWRVQSRAVRTVHESHNELAGYGAEEGSCVWYDELGGLAAESSPVREERGPND